MANLSATSVTKIVRLPTAAGAVIYANMIFAQLATESRQQNDTEINRCIV
jgi:hypothetical protein